MSGFNFEDALNTKASDIEKPPVQPMGNYIWGVSKTPTMDTSKSGEWAFIEFPVRGVSAEDDVDPDELAAFGDVSSAMSRVSFVFPTDPAKEADAAKTKYRLKRFLEETLRVDCEEDATLKEMLDASVNCQFYGTVGWKQVNDEIYAEIKHTAPLD